MLEELRRKGATSRCLSRPVVWLVGAAALLGASIVLPAQQDKLAAQTRDTASDQRQPIVVTDDERAFILQEMRGLLESVGEILEASEASDRARVAAAGRRSGMNGPESEHIPKTLGAKLPPEFKRLGLVTHRAFDQIALDADQFSDSKVTRRQLVEMMRNCTACHATWRLAGEDKR